MGCDIHMYVEQKQADGSWKFLPPPEVELWKKQDGTPYMGKYWYFGRNYTLFGYLADVRNELGWGTSRVQPLDSPRGIPEDASAEYKQIAGPYSECSEPCEGAELDDYGYCDREHGWGEDGHSHTYFTLRELLDAGDQRNRKVQHRGWVTPSEYAKFKAEGSPTSWCGSVGGGNVQHIDNKRMDAMLVAHPELAAENKPFGLSSSVPGLPTYYTEIHWTNEAHENFGVDWEDFLKRLQELSTDDGNDVRAVFFFDN